MNTKDIFSYSILLLSIACGISVISLLLSTKKYKNFKHRFVSKRGTIFYKLKDDNKKQVDLVQFLDTNKVKVIKTFTIDKKTYDKIEHNAILYVRRNAVVNNSRTIPILFSISMASFFTFAVITVLN
jgi:hypothetical protein